MRAIVLGASGLIGSTLFETLITAGIPTLGTRHNSARSGNFLRFDLLTDNILQLIPDIDRDDTIYLLSAYTDPSWIFANKDIAERLNYLSTMQFIDTVRPRGPRIVFMSSVEVFDGTTGGYSENDRTHPLNYYGILKGRIEGFLVSSYPRSCIVRTGWNVSPDLHSRCVVKLTYETLLKPNAVMARDNAFSIIDVNDTARGLARLMNAPDVTKIHLSADRTVNRVWLAQRIRAGSAYGHLMAFKVGTFGEIPYSEPRGRLNDLSNSYSKSALDLSYRSIEDIIDSKVRLLDAHFKGLDNERAVFQ